MNLLILGGTIFLGRHLVAVALEQGHAVTLFNRGRHPNPFPDVEQLHGDRDGGLSVLGGRRWDAVVDTSGYVPRIVRDSAQTLADAVDRYVFISTISVYADAGRPGLDEDAPVGQLAEATEQVTGETYGPLKALCEQAVEEALPDRTLTIRPGLIVGPDDPTDRFTYWVRRVAQGGEVLAPGRPDRLIQYIDVRDLARWTIHMAETRATGTYNATGPDIPQSMGDLLQTARDVSKSDARFTWVDEGWLLNEGVEPWSELPLWIPEDDAESAGIMAINIDKATAAGLTFRPLSTTVQDTLAWDRTRPPDIERRAGLAPDREAALLQAWRTRREE
jgi:2'-hydroxyisoflavone reductase